MSEQKAYDLLLRGGHVICPASGIDGVMDVAVRDGRIAAVDHGEGQVPEQVDNQGTGQFLHELAPARPDSGQRRHLGKQGREAQGAHGC